MREAIDLLFCRANSEETSKYDSAISVLIAAERVDKKRGLECIERANEYLGTEGDETWDSLRALLESLPDEEKS